MNFRQVAAIVAGVIIGLALVLLFKAGLERYQAAKDRRIERGSADPPASSFRQSARTGPGTTQY